MNKLYKGEVAMNKVIAAVLLGLVFSVSVMAQQAPNVIGTWVGETNDAVIGAGRHYPNGKANEIRFRIKID